MAAMRGLLLGVIAVAAACGNDGVQHIADAPTISDSLGIDAPSPQPVSIVVTVGGVPQPGVHVFFTNFDSSPVAMHDTDATGTATERIASGGFVTAVDPFPPIADIAASNLYTFAAVKPGDHLVLAANAATPVTTTFTLTTSNVASAASYAVYSPCGNGELTPANGSDVLAPTGTIHFEGCTTSDVLVVAYDGAGQAISSFFHPQLAVTNGATIDLADAYVAASSATYTYTNLPTTSVTATFSLVSTAGFLDSVVGSAPVASGSATLALHQPALDGASGVVDTSFAGVMTGHDVIDWGTAGGDYTLDATSQTLPDIVQTPEFALTTDTLTWLPGAGTVTPDFAIATVSFGADPNVQSWQIVTPYIVGSIAFPQLPNYIPVATDTPSIDRLVTAKVPGGYDAVRAHALSPTDAYYFFGGAASGRALLAGFTGATIRKRRR
jgi:hypothetical protein